MCLVPSLHELAELVFFAIFTNVAIKVSSDQDVLIWGDHLEVRAEALPELVLLLISTAYLRGVA